MTESDKIMTHILNSKLNQARKNLSENQHAKYQYENQLSEVNKCIKSNEQEIQALTLTLDKLNLPQESF